LGAKLPQLSCATFVPCYLEQCECHREHQSLPSAANAHNPRHCTVHFCTTSDPAGVWSASLEIGLGALGDEATRRTREAVAGD